MGPGEQAESFARRLRIVPHVLILTDEAPAGNSRRFKMLACLRTLQYMRDRQRRRKMSRFRSCKFKHDQRRCVHYHYTTTDYRNIIMKVLPLVCMYPSTADMRNVRIMPTKARSLNRGRVGLHFDCEFSLLLETVSSITRMWPDDFRAQTFSLQTCEYHQRLIPYDL